MPTGTTSRCKALPYHQSRSPPNATICFASSAAISSVAICVQRGYDEDWLGDTFSRAVLFGNGLVAILAGLLANTLVTTLALGPVAPFDAALAVLLIGGAVIVWAWPENYGDKTAGSNIVARMQGAVACIRGDVRVFLLGAMQVRRHWVFRESGAVPQAVDAWAAHFVRAYSQLHSCGRREARSCDACNLVGAEAAMGTTQTWTRNTSEE